MDNEEWVNCKWVSHTIRPTNQLTNNNNNNNNNKNNNKNNKHNNTHRFIQHPRALLQKSFQLRNQILRLGQISTLKEKENEIETG